MSMLDTHALAPLIAKLSRRSELSAADIQAVLNLPYRLAIADPGGYFVRDGDKPAECILLRSGFAYRSKVAGSGARQILSVHLRGDLIGLQNSLLGEADHSVQALTQVEFASIPQQALLDIATAHPTFSHALWRDTFVDASIFREWLLNVGQRDARQRISHLFCEFALRQEEAQLCSGPRYDWPLTQEQIGDATGLTSVHVNRMIQAMTKDGLIKIANRVLTINDWPKLKRAGDFNRAYLHQTGRIAA